MAEQIVDACCVINLYSTGMEAQILRACDGEFYISTQVQNEALTIRVLSDEEPPQLVSQTIDLADVVAEGLVKLCQLEGQDETDAYVRFATQLDDGEASCLAIASVRGWKMATDDKKATRIARESGIAVVTTAELVHDWVVSESPSDEEAVEAIQRIEQLARFRPRRGSPQSAWWYQLLEDASP